MHEARSSQTSAVAPQLEIDAKAHMKRGLALLEKNSPDSLREAISCFDAAIELRRQLPLSENCWFRYGLIAAWMNRGDALTRLGSADELNEALRSYDEAFAHLRELPMHESPLFIKRLGIAWSNRGITLMKQATPRSVAEAAESFREAIAAARNLFALDAVEGRPLLAGAWMNLGNALVHLQPPDATEARSAAVESLKLCCDFEREDALIAEISFKARHVLCQALGHLLSDRVLSSAQRDALLAEASDVVDAGMALARHWETRGANPFRGLAVQLFRFGCRVYQIHQPHFLTEFLLENLDPALADGAMVDNLEMHASALEAIWQVLGEYQREGFRAINTPRFAQFVERLRELRIADERLALLRRELEEGSRERNF